MTVLVIIASLIDVPVRRLTVDERIIDVGAINGGARKEKKKRRRGRAKTIVAALPQCCFWKEVGSAVTTAVSARPGDQRPHGEGPSRGPSCATPDLPPPLTALHNGGTVVLSRYHSESRGGCCGSGNERSLLLMRQ